MPLVTLIRLLSLLFNRRYASSAMISPPSKRPMRQYYDAQAPLRFHEMPVTAHARRRLCRTTAFVPPRHTISALFDSSLLSIIDAWLRARHGRRCCLAVDFFAARLLALIVAHMRFATIRRDSPHEADARDTGRHRRPIDRRELLPTRLAAPRPKNIAGQRAASFSPCGCLGRSTPAADMPGFYRSRVIVDAI